MPGDLYRDANLGIRARAAELVARIRDREAELTDAFWSSLDAASLERRHEMNEALEVLQAGKDLSFEEMTRLEAPLAVWVDDLERLIAALPAVEAEWAVAPDFVADPPMPSGHWLGTTWTEPVASLERLFTSVITARYPDAEIERDGLRSFIARFRERGAPIVLRATALSIGETVVEEVMMQMHTSVRRSMPKISLRQETFAMTFGKALGIRQEIEVGEPSFDGLFLIQGDEAAAKRFLNVSVRSILLALARYDVPTLEIDPPGRVCRLAWRFEPNHKAIDLAIRLLGAVRELESEVRFVRQ